MTQTTRIGIAALLVLGIAVISFLPMLELKATIPSARLVLLNMALPGAVVAWEAPFFHDPDSDSVTPDFPPPLGSLVDLECVRLC
jgi:hypothetical protein